MLAIILAGGFGSRLRSVIHDVPKPMAPIADQPFLAYLLAYLQQQGFNRIIFSVHYQHEKIQQFFGNFYKGIEISYAVESEPLGTGGAICHALQQVTNDQPVFILNGDTFVRLDYRQMYQQYIALHAAMSMALYCHENCSRYGKVVVENGIVTSFQQAGEVGSGLINAGVYLISKKALLNYQPPQKFSFEQNFLHEKVSILRPLAFMTDAYFIDIGIPADYQRAQQELPKWSIQPLKDPRVGVL